jgi:hypothetical protein
VVKGGGGVGEEVFDSIDKGMVATLDGGGAVLAFFLSISNVSLSPLPPAAVLVPSTYVQTRQGYHFLLIHPACPSPTFSWRKRTTLRWLHAPIHHPCPTSLCIHVNPRPHPIQHRLPPPLGALTRKPPISGQKHSRLCHPLTHRCPPTKRIHQSLPGSYGQMTIHGLIL